MAPLHPPADAHSRERFQKAHALGKRKRVHITPSAQAERYSFQHIRVPFMLVHYTATHYLNTTSMRLPSNITALEPPHWAIRPRIRA